MLTFQGYLGVQQDKYAMDTIIIHIAFCSSWFEITNNFRLQPSDGVCIYHHTQL